MIRAYQQGKDLYAAMASSLYNIPYEGCLNAADVHNSFGMTYEEFTDKWGKDGKTYRSNVKAILLGKYNCPSKIIVNPIV